MFGEHRVQKFGGYPGNLLCYRGEVQKFRGFINLGFTFLEGICVCVLHFDKYSVLININITGSLYVHVSLILKLVLVLTLSTYCWINWLHTFSRWVVACCCTGRLTCAEG